jgi:hypothetical protein
MKALAPTKTEPAFLIVQRAAFVFVALTILAAVTPLRLT